MSWWKTGVIYQIYPRSFQDSNGDGIGDLAGIIHRLDYLKWLGVDAVWISPVYPSPMVDFGYDISDHCDIHPMFGDLATFNQLVTAIHTRGLKLIMDYVPNHTSDRHPWFLESKSSRDNPKADWYIWQDPKPDGSPPNNWLSLFGGTSAWEWCQEREQYYLHSFLVEQPDVNWRHPAAREAMLDVARFWFERGVDGLRIDASIEALKDPDLRDDPINPDWREGMDPFLKLKHVYSENTIHNHQLNRWLREVAETYDDRAVIGETYLNSAELAKHYGNDDEFHIAYNFQLITDPRWDPDIVRQIADEYDATVSPVGQPSWVLGNHDRHRVASRVGPKQVPVAMTLLLTLHGTPTIYYGDELGMEDVSIPPEKEVDPWGLLSPGLNLGRDPERTPMQWDSTLNAGFCDGSVEPWLPVADDYSDRNVTAQMARPGSVLLMTRQLLEIRRDHPALHSGSYRSVDGPPGTFCYVREHQDERLLLILNFTDDPKKWWLPAGLNGGNIIFSTNNNRPTPADIDQLLIMENEAIIISLK